MVCSPLALPHGLVPQGQGSKAGAEQTPGLGRAGRGVSPRCSLTLQNPITAPGPYKPSPCSFSVSNLINCSMTGRLGSGCSGAGERHGAGLVLALFLCGHLAHCSHRATNSPKKQY